MGTPTVLLARTDAEAGDLGHQRRRRQRQAVLHRRAHRRRLLPHQHGLQQAISRGLAYAESPT
jgi:isocitrate lyase